MKKALLQLHAAVFLWGFTGVLGRAISLDATLLVWYRLLITLVSLWVLFAVQNKISRIPARSVLLIGGIGLVQALHWVTFYGSIKLANVTIALTCLSTSALLSSLIEPLLLKQKFQTREIFLGFFALAGILVIYNSHLQFSWGIIVGLVSALLTVLVSVLNKKYINQYTPQQITLYQFTGGFTGLTLLLPLLLQLAPNGWQWPTAFDWVWLAVLSWLCTILTFFLYIRSLKHISAFTMNLTLTLEPLYGIALAFFLYQENKYLSNWFYLGFLLIALAVVLHMVMLLRPKRS
ncbi:EamA-like transporter family protein [Cnuella takakiae]|uniref:EamA-like transporter family protein n=1 Tax=Cnuella takakiae TaxID=1302690 RepID=A0A1M5G5Q3_9BACT|nr:EamA family transporter [Cnuella takakiae]OLY92339.1 EamA family transporter [Cnuella takakiae]SHF98994.1 EamA-like transporter family protein [Cnuella takakiae]